MNVSDSVKIVVAVLFWTSIAAWDWTWAAAWDLFVSSSLGVFLLPLLPRLSIENLKRFALGWVVLIAVAITYRIVVVTREAAPRRRAAPRRMDMKPSKKTR